MHSGFEGIWCICLSNSPNMKQKMMFKYLKMHLPPHSTANIKKTHFGGDI